MNIGRQRKRDRERRHRSEKKLTQRRTKKKSQEL